MNTPEERLRRLADDERWNDRTPPRLDLGTHRAGRQRRRTGLILAAAGVTVLAVAGAGLAIGHFSHRQATTAPASSGKTETVIPWKPIRPARRAADVTNPPVCDAGELTAHSGGVGPAGGSWNMGIDVSNSGPLCSIPNSSVTLRAPTDSGPGTILAKANEGGDGRYPELIAGHSSVNYHVTFDSSCQPTQTSGRDRTLSMGFAGNEVPVTGTTVPPELASCASVFLGEPETAIDEVDPYPQLAVSLALPESAKAGSTLAYTVTLTNRWRKPFTFPSCPSYYQQLSVPGTGKRAPKWTQVGRTVSYTLNCTSMKALTRGQQATFAMRTRLPSAPGSTMLEWHLKYYSGPSAVGTLVLD